MMLCPQTQNGVDRRVVVNKLELGASVNIAGSARSLKVLVTV